MHLHHKNAQLDRKFKQVVIRKKTFHKKSEQLLLEYMYVLVFVGYQCLYDQKIFVSELQAFFQIYKLFLIKKKKEKIKYKTK